MPKRAEPADEDLAARCAEEGEGGKAAEEELLRRYMTALYGLPRRAFAADADTCGEFLLFALDKLRERRILGRFDPRRGARFATWFGSVIRHLFLDFLRTQQGGPTFLALDEERLAAPEAAPEARPSAEPAGGLLARMETRCRTLFKMLLANAFFFTPEEIRWIAANGKRSVIESVSLLAEMEEDLREAEAAIEKRHQALAAAYWWKRAYERQLALLEAKPLPYGRLETRRMKTLRARLEKRREQHRRLLERLSGSAGFATAPYRKIAAILRMKEGTLGSHLTRCRQAA
ncbi:MAG: sigma-70 family RNA polymerase sigma factor, partial [Planctomycetota bacterium]